ncbi:MAG: hypothetical protein ACK5LC_07560 [Coprobacillaceae bacterium]
MSKTKKKRNPFKHSGEVSIKQPSENKYLERSKIENNCFNEPVDNDKIQLTDRTVVEVYRMSFLKDNGIDSSVDRENQDILSHVLSLIQYDYKFIIFNERKEMLKTNISFFEQRKSEAKFLEDVIQNRLNIMYLFENIKYKTFYIMIDIKCQEFQENASRVLYLEKLQDNELLDFAKILNNLI